MIPTTKTKRSRPYRLLSRVILACITYALPETATAGIFTWDGGGGDNLWGTGTNWSADSAPNPAGTDILNFSGSTRPTPDINQNWVVDGIDFGGATTGFTLNASSSHTVTLPTQTGIDDSGSGLSHVVNFDIVLTKFIFNDIAANSTIQFNGDISGAFDVNKRGAGTMTLGSAVSMSSLLYVREGDVRLLEGSTLASAIRIELGDGSTTEGSLLLADSDGGTTWSTPIVVNSTGVLSIQAENTSGTNTLSGNMTLNGDIGIETTSGGTLDISGVISGANDVTISGSGTLELSGANTYTGDTTVSGGTLLLGASGVLSDSTNLTLSGGTFDTGSFDETLGNLTLTASSTIDLGAGGGGDSDLIFSDSSAISWTGTLHITDFDSATDSLRFGTDANGLSAQQLSQILFIGPDGSGSNLYTATLDSNGYLQLGSAIVPEASTYLSAGSLLLLASFLEYRRRKASTPRAIQKERECEPSVSPPPARTPFA